MRALEGDRQNGRRRPQSQMEKKGAIRRLQQSRPPAKRASAARRAHKAAHKRANPAGHGEAQAPNAIAVERRKLRAQVVDLEPHRQRRMASIEVRRAEHGNVSKRISFDSQHTGWG